MIKPMALPLLPPCKSKAWRLALMFMVLIPLAYGALALFLGQDANWDLRNYHWYNAYAFLNNRYAMDLLPSQTPYFYNPTLDLPFFLLATHVSAKAAAFVLASVQGLNFILLFMIAHACLIINNQRNKVIACAIIAAFGLLGAGSIAQVGTVFYDNITSLGIFTSALIAISNLDRLIKDKWQKAVAVAVVAGIPAGLAFGLKLPSVVFCVGLCGAFLFTAGSIQRRFVIGFAFGIGVLLGMAVTLGHWAWFLQENFGSPLFPYFNGFFNSPLAPPDSARDIQYIQTSLRDTLLFPYIFTDNPLRTGEIPWRDWRIATFYTLLPISLVVCTLFGRNAEREDAIAAPYAARYLLWTAFISYFTWLVMFSIYRYAVPLEMMAPLLIVLVIGMLPLKVHTRGLLITFVMIVLAATLQPGDWGRKKEWLGRTVEISTPTISDPDNTMIIMAGFEPYSHVITEFPPQIPFVRIQSNFSRPEEGKGINNLIRKRIEAHAAKGGKFMLLLPKWQHKMAKNALKYYSFVAQMKTCQTIDDRLYDKLDLCNLSRTEKP